jgi:hypothetical protein
MNKINTYNTMTLDSLVIEIVELSLTLIKVVKVCTLQCNLSMGFIDLGTTVKANKRIITFTVKSFWMR